MMTDWNAPTTLGTQSRKNVSTSQRRVQRIRPAIPSLENVKMSSSLCLALPLLTSGMISMAKNKRFGRSFALRTRVVPFVF